MHNICEIWPWRQFTVKFPSLFGEAKSPFTTFRISLSFKRNILLPNGHQKTKVIQSYLRIWGTYDPIELGPSEPKKWGFHRCSIKKCIILEKKWAPASGPRPALQRSQHKNVAYWVSSHDSNKKFGPFPKKKDFGPKNCIFGPKFCIFLRYTYETPIFSAQTDPAQLDHKSPISWGNSG